jgi:uncharacterized ferredoxin-like protein
LPVKANKNNKSIAPKVNRRKLPRERVYETIILHIGTNDLVREDTDKVAEKMEELIEEVKHRAERVAVLRSIQTGRDSSLRREFSIFNDI